MFVSIQNSYGRGKPLKSRPNLKFKASALGMALVRISFHNKWLLKGGQAESLKTAQTEY